MKTFSNKSCAGIMNEQKIPLTYAKVCVEVCLQQPPLNQNGQPVGFTPDEMTRRIKIQNVLEKEGETIKLEDSDAVKLLECINASRWSKLDKDVLQFVEDMNTDLTGAIPVEK